jgi:hypothetical protein
LVSGVDYLGSATILSAAAFSREERFWHILSVLRYSSAKGGLWCGFLNIFRDQRLLHYWRRRAVLNFFALVAMDQTMVLLLTFSALLLCSLRIGLASRHYISQFPCTA